MNKEVTAASEQDLLGLGVSLSTNLGHGMLVGLSGDLGAGKTTLVRGILRGLGYEGTVKSPTFTLVEPYQLGKRNIYHFDLYRMESPDELEGIGFRDYLEKSGLILMEWPEKAGSFLPQMDLEIIIKIINEGRRIELVSDTSKGDRVLGRL